MFSIVVLQDSGSKNSSAPEPRRKEDETLNLSGVSRLLFKSQFKSLSHSSERILIWCSCGTRAEIFELSRATDVIILLILFILLILSGASRSGNRTPFATRFRYVSEERGSLSMHITSSR